MGLLYGMEWTQDKLKNSRRSGRRCLAFCLFFGRGLKLVVGEGQRRGKFQTMKKELRLKGVNTHQLRQGENWVLIQQG